MRRLLRCGSVVAFVLLAGCDVAEPLTDTTTGEEEVASESQALEPPPKESESCLDDTYVGVTTTGSCPGGGQGPTGYWKYTPVFAGATEPLMRSHCGYKWMPFNATSAPDATRLPTMGGLPPTKWLSRDCFVAAPLALDLDEVRRKVGAERTASTRAQLGTPQYFPPGPSAAVRVAVIDTSPTSVDGLPVLGANHHGHDVARLIEDVACGNGSRPCKVQVTTVLGLPRVGPATADYENGGSFGTQLDIANAIHRTVAAWRALPAAVRPKLILNLSLGWNRRNGGDIASGASETGFRGPVRSVYDALRYAACSNVLVIAAAGNDGGGPIRDEGAMVPGSWESRRAPTFAECQTLLGPSFTPLGGNYAPIVQAVGAVDAADNEATITPIDGRPRLVAPGVGISARLEKDTVIVNPDGSRRTVVQTEYTTPRTGTSMAAAAVSGAAAVVWSLRPNYSREDVMELLSGTGAPLGTNASFALGTVPRQIKRLDVCGAVTFACATSPTCTETPVCVRRPAFAGSIFTMSPSAADAVVTAFSSMPAIPLTIDLLTEHTPAHCGESAIALGPNAAIEPCPDRTYYGEPSVPFALPQPSGNGDPEVWAMVRNYVSTPAESRFDMFIDRDETHAFDLANTTLTLTFGRDRTTYALGALTFDDATHNMKLTFQTRRVAPSSFTDAALTFTMTGTRVTVMTSPVSVAFVTVP